MVAAMIAAAVVATAVVTAAAMPVANRINHAAGKQRGCGECGDQLKEALNKSPIAL